MRDLTGTTHLDPAWAERFVLAARIQGARGRAVGAALAEMDAYCCDSGESAWEAFGDPEAHLAGLRLPVEDAQVVDLRGDLPPLAAGLLGMLLTIMAVGSLVSGTGVVVTVGSIAGVILLGLAAWALLRYAAAFLGWFVAHRVLGVVAAGLTPLVFLAVFFLGRTPVGELPAVAVLVAGLVLLTVGTLGERRRLAAIGDDEIVSPAEAAGVGTLRVGRGGRAVSRVTPYLYPLLTLVMCVPMLAVRH